MSILQHNDEVRLIVASTLLAATGGYLYNFHTRKEKKVHLPKREWMRKSRIERDAKSFTKLGKGELRLQDKHAYRRYLKINEECFVDLLGYVKEAITKKDTKLRDAIPAEESLSIFLRFLATGESFRKLDEETNISASFLSYAVQKCCKAFYAKLKSQFIKFPASTAEWQCIANEYESQWEFPLCLGALDVKHIAFKASKKVGKLYYNTAGFNSIILLAMCDANYKFNFIDVGYNGRISDTDVLNHSELSTVLENANEHFPLDGMIGNGRKLPYCIIADEGFPLQEHLLKPYPHNTQKIREKIFNFRLSHARQSINRAFSMMVDKFRVLQSNMHLKPEKVKAIVLTCCILHNYLLEKTDSYNEQLYEEPKPLSQQEESEYRNPVEPDILARKIRDKFANYFSKEGSWPLQDVYLTEMDVDK